MNTDQVNLGSSPLTAESLAETPAYRPCPTEATCIAADRCQGKCSQPGEAHSYQSPEAIRARDLERQRVLDLIELAMPSEPRSVNWSETERIAFEVLTALAERVRDE